MEEIQGGVWLGRALVDLGQAEIGLSLTVAARESLDRAAAIFVAAGLPQDVRGTAGCGNGSVSRESARPVPACAVSRGTTRRGGSADRRGQALRGMASRTRCSSGASPQLEPNVPDDPVDQSRARAGHAEVALPDSVQAGPLRAEC